MQITVGSDGLLLIFFGTLLFVTGLFQGLAIPALRNSRMGLSAHLTAVQAGTAVVVFGLIWCFVKLPPLILMFTKFGLISGNYFIWGGITLAAITGASKALPIAGKGYKAGRYSELAVSFLMVLGTALLLFSSVFFMFGLGFTVFEPGNDSAEFGS